MKLFLIIVIAGCSLPGFSQTHPRDTSIKDLQQQIAALNSRVDSLRAIATERSDMLNRLGQQRGDLFTRLQHAREATIFDPHLFVDSMVHRMYTIYNGKSDFTLKSIQQVIAFQQVMQKAATVYPPGQKALIDSLTVAYMAIDKPHQQAQQAFDDSLILLDKYVGELEELKKKLNTKP
jgi:hypothetical protein